MKYVFFTFIIIGSNALYSMNNEQQRYQNQINRGAKEQIEKAKSNQVISIDPRANINLQFAATHHNMQARNNIFMAHQQQLYNKK